MTYGDARPGGRERGEGGMAEVNPGLCQNPLNHSLMSTSLFNETQTRFLMRKHLCAAGKAGYVGISKKRLEENSSKCARGKVVLMVAVWACCHQALRNRVDRIFVPEKKMFHWSCMLLPAFQSWPCCFNIKTRQKPQ